jgi:hypothetical protein
MSALRAEPESQVMVHLKMVSRDDEDALFVDELLDEQGNRDCALFRGLAHPLGANINKKNSP